MQNHHNNISLANNSFAFPIKMTTTRQFRCEDLFKFNAINFDHLTETYNVSRRRGVFQRSEQVLQTI